MSKARIARLRSLPQRQREVWQGTVVELPVSVTCEGESPYRPLPAVWGPEKQQAAGPSHLSPPDGSLLDAAVAGLSKFAYYLGVGGHRAERTEVRAPALAEHLRAVLAGVGIEVACVEQMPFLDPAVEVLLQGLTGTARLPGPLAGKE